MVQVAVNRFADSRSNWVIRASPLAKVRDVGIRVNGSPERLESFRTQFLLQLVHDRGRRLAMGAGGQQKLQSDDFTLVLVQRYLLPAGESDGVVRRRAGNGLPLQHCSQQENSGGNPRSHSF